MGTGYVYFAAAGDYASSPDTSAVSLTDDQSIAVRVMPDNWLRADTQTLFAKYYSAGNQRSIWFNSISGSSGLGVSLSSNGTAFSTYASTASMAVAGASLIVPTWVRADIDFTGSVVRFYFSETDTNTLASVVWTQVGVAVAITQLSAFDSSAPIEIGLREASSTSELVGRVYRVVLLDGGISGTVVFDADFTDLTAAEIAAEAFSEDSANAATVSLNGSTYVAVPDAAELHGDALFEYILEYGALTVTDTELVGALNELNGTTGVEYAQARATYLGVDPAG